MNTRIHYQQRPQVKLHGLLNDTDNSTYADAFEIWENEIAYMLRPECSLIPSLPATVQVGQVANVNVTVSSLGLRAAMQGQVTLSVPAGLGTVQGTATQSFTTPLNPGSNETLSWQVKVTGTGSYTLNFTASYNGYKGTSYSAFSKANTSASSAAGTSFPIIVIVAIVAVVIVLLVAVLLLKARKTSGKSAPKRKK